MIRSRARLSLIAASTLAATVVLAACAGTMGKSSSMGFFISSTGSGKGGDLGGLAGADSNARRSRPRPAPATRPGAPISAPSRWRRRPSTRATASAPGPWQNAKGVVVATERDRTARRQQPHQADRADRKGRGGQRPRRHAEHARHPDRLAAGRHGDRRRRGHDLRQLDQAAARRGDGRPSRPHRPRRERAGEVVELVAPVARLQPRRVDGTGGAGCIYCFAAN